MPKIKHLLDRWDYGYLCGVTLVLFGEMISGKRWVTTWLEIPVFIAVMLAIYLSIALINYWLRKPRYRLHLQNREPQLFRTMSETLDAIDGALWFQIDVLRDGAWETFISRSDSRGLRL